MARTGRTEYSLLMPRAHLRVARRIIADHFRGSMDQDLAWPAWVVVAAHDEDLGLAELHAEASTEVQALVAQARRIDVQDGPATMSMATYDGALVATEIDDIEWIRANEHVTTFTAPLHAALSH